jgi:hypothetical protein
MVTVYFLIGIVFLVYEAYVAINPAELVDSYKRCDMEDGSLITIKPLILVGFFYTIWAFIGMVASSQFILFILLFIVACLSWIFKRTATPQKTLNIVIMDSITGFIIIAVIIYRHFYQV